jgi:hypothetical protein
MADLIRGVSGLTAIILLRASRTRLQSCLLGSYLFILYSPYAK